MKTPVLIGTLIDDLASRYSWGHHFSRRTVWKSWLEIAGDAIAGHAWPLGFMEHNILVVAVSDSVWMQQLSLQKLTLLKALNRSLPPESSIRDIRFRLEDVNDVRLRYMPTSRAAETCRVLLPSDVEKEIHEHAEALTEPVRDGELRKILRDVYVKSVARASAS